MSDNSLKRTLELLEGTKPNRKSGRRERKSRNPFMRAPSPPKVTLSSIIKSKKKTKPSNSQPKPQSSRPTNTSMARNKVQQKPKSKVEENLKKLLMFSSPVNLDSETTRKLVKRAQTQKYVISEPKSNEQQETVFTDEDFCKFEREYFCS